MKQTYKILSICIILILIIIIGIFFTIKTKNNIGSTQAEVTESDNNKNISHGSIQIINDFYSPELDNKKTLRIYLPYGYENSDKKYPVIYMPDGQNLFDTKTASYNMEWGIDETLDELCSEGKTNGAIVVGVDSVPETRENEYNPFIGISQVNQSTANVDGGGKGDEYAKFIVSTLKPYIDKNYRTLPDKKNTAIVGSSYGAVISLYTAIEYNDKFSMVGAISFYGELNPDKMKQYLTEKLSPDKLKDTKIYFSVGTNDFAYNSTNVAYNIAKQNNLKEIVYEEDDGSHNELSFGPNFKKCYKFFGL